LHSALHGLDHDEAKFAEALEKQGSSREEFDANTRSNAEKAIKTQLLLDALGDDLDIQVSQQDLTERLVLSSQQYGIEPQQLLAYLQQNDQLPAMFADVRRGLTIAAAVEAATVTDTDGNVVDTEEFFGTRSQPEAGNDGKAAGVDKVGEAGEEAEAVDAGEAAASSEEPSGDTK
jgi:trigger factor